MRMMMSRNQKPNFSKHPRQLPTPSKNMPAKNPSPFNIHPPMLIKNINAKMQMIINNISIAISSALYYYSYPIPLDFQSSHASTSLPARCRLISKAISLAMAIRRSSHTVTSNAIRRVKEFTSPLPPST